MLPKGFFDTPKVLAKKTILKAIWSKPQLTENSL